MKHTLEYKILKHLSENDNGKFLDIAEIESNIELLKSVISDLKERKLILTKPYPRIPWDSSIRGVIGSSPSDKPEKCKIKLSGKEYLESLKPQPIPKFQKIYLPFFILFGLFGVYKTFLPSISKADYENLKYQSEVFESQVDSLTNESQIYKDSLAQLNQQLKLYKKQSIIDSSQTKKYPDVNK
ncbi:hypothetical protein [Cyclobacterium marinum]|uniref:hypothetical protein n=1 Tax=Cyclobacterium marinum TaxID=104 RepID=UPI0011EF3285|nr:hypothetical protein [Cyclobacterium marinum]MBI0397561.1 hypothetical protein [Cyclobacterium marinum]